jgi:hypothetical protein
MIVIQPAYPKAPEPVYGKDAEPVVYGKPVPEPVVYGKPVPEPTEQPDIRNNSNNLFFDPSNGIYLTFTLTEIKLSIYRAILRILTICFIVLLFLAFWDLCDLCILIITISTCAAPCIGLSFLQPLCTAGIIASMWRGFTVASSIAEIHVQWKI